MDQDRARAATARLLWAACRTTPDRLGVEQAIEDGADVDTGARVALTQGCGPLLTRALRGVGSVADLGETGRLLETEALLRRAHAEVVLPTAVALAVEPLVAAGLEPMLFKGAALAGRYPEAGLRPMVDIDMVLPPEQHDEAVRVLTSHSWRVLERSGQHHDTYLRHGQAPDLPLELHRDLYVWHDRATRMSGADLWHHRMPAQYFGVAAYGLGPEVELVALAAHAGKPHHHFHRLIWSVDFAVVIEAAGSHLDWDAVERLAEDAGCRTAVAVGLHQAARLGTTSPAHLRQPVAGRIRRASLAPLFDEEWPLAECDDGLHRRLRYALWDSAARRMALFVGEIVEAGPRYAPRRAATLFAFGLRRAWKSLRTPRAGV